MKVEPSEDGKTLRIESDFGGSREVTNPTDTVCITVSRWMVEYMSEALLELAHPKIKVRGKEEVNLRETLIETADGILKVRDLLRDLSSPPKPSTMNTIGAPSDTEYIRAVDNYIKEKANQQMP